MLTRLLRYVGLMSVLLLALALPATSQAQADFNYENFYWDDYYGSDIYNDFGWDYDWFEGWEYETPYAEYDYEFNLESGEWKLEEDGWWLT